MKDYYITNRFLGRQNNTFFLATKRGILKATQDATFAARSEQAGRERAARSWS